MVLLKSANAPLAVFPEPAVLLKSAPAPVAVLLLASLARSVPAPMAVLKLWVLSPATLISAVAGPEETKNLAGQKSSA